MCGIAGILSLSKSIPADEAIALRMRDAMPHRGPDDAGSYSSPDRRIVLAHRRLSIVDLSPAGHQPMSNEDGTVWVTFNGEIYNHQDHRPALEAAGHRFRSRTDTEVIVHLYEARGEEFVADLDGMFALALWDSERGRLLLARDRLGKKPLYYARIGPQLLFASEIKALLEYPGLTRDIDPVALDHYLTFSNVPAPRTLFAGISKLPAAHLLVCDAQGAMRTRRYWTPLSGLPWPIRIDASEAVERVRALLTRAVEKRMMSDVPIGALLSGGIDSSANVALMAELTGRPPRTFSIGFTGFGPAENFHDLPYARQVADRFGCIHTEVSLTAPDLVQALPLLARQQDEPLGDPACIPMYFLCKAVRERNVTVILVGEGSDEVFGGYDEMARGMQTHGGRWQQVMRLPRLLRHGLHRAARLGRMPAGRVDLLRRAAVEDPLYWGLDVVFWEEEKRRLLQPSTRRPDAVRASEIVRGYYDTLRAHQPGADFLQQVSWVELCNRLPDLLLMRVDKFSMAHSLEARAPFLDHALVAYALSLPADLKIHNGASKYVLKEAVRPLLPPEILARRKQGFRVPLPAWLAGELSAWSEHHLFHTRIAERSLFRTDFVRTLWEQHRSGRQDNSFDLWCLISLSAWYETWFA